MKAETLINLVGAIVFGLLGLMASFAAMFLFAWWHMAIAVCSLSLSYALYKDDECGAESVQSYVKRIKSK